MLYLFAIYLIAGFGDSCVLICFDLFGCVGVLVFVILGFACLFVWRFWLCFFFWLVGTVDFAIFIVCFGFDCCFTVCFG